MRLGPMFAIVRVVPVANKCPPDDAAPVRRRGGGAGTIVPLPHHVVPTASSKPPRFGDEWRLALSCVTTNTPFMGAGKSTYRIEPSSRLLGRGNLSSSGVPVREPSSLVRASLAVDELISCAYRLVRVALVVIPIPGGGGDGACVFFAVPLRRLDGLVAIVCRWDVAGGTRPTEVAAEPPSHQATETCR